MLKGAIYQTPAGQTVEILKYHDQIKRYACIHNGYMLAWYTKDGKCEMFDSQKLPERYNIDFSKGYDK